MQKTVLIIEDNPGHVRLAKEVLEGAGYRVLMATNGIDGMRKAAEDNPDLVILDLMLPGLDGFEVCHRLRSDPRNAFLPIVVLSAKAQQSDKDMAAHVGADMYLTKPADPLEILDRVQTLLEDVIGADG